MFFKSENGDHKKKDRTNFLSLYEYFPLRAGLVEQ